MAVGAIDELSETWAVWLRLRWGFDLAAWDARVASLPPVSGAHATARRHRGGLLRALEARDDEAISDKLELMARTTSMAAGKKQAEAGIALNKARAAKKRKDINEWIARQLRRDPSAKSPALWARAPTAITDQIAIGRFAKRVTEVRKQLKTDASQ